ncbi:hypothetical protein KP509_01G037500 [Ceratopteris richardii]|uniref:Secreted protein n=1 Tax=Ceratopteris richardii TaxID=49495 RepID=A0A8T2VFS9_CERRI|nr:hypothetical protein KP509_01G037500 [Ceratopteris richardii]
MIFLTLALLLLTTEKCTQDKENNVQETVDVVNNPRGSTGIQNGDEERNVFPGDIICPPSLTDRFAVSSVAAVVVSLRHTVTSS